MEMQTILLLYFLIQYISKQQHQDSKTKTQSSVFPTIFFSASLLAVGICDLNPETIIYNKKFIMASQEHLQMLDDGDSSTTTTSGDGDESTSSETDMPTNASMNGTNALSHVRSQHHDNGGGGGGGGGGNSVGSGSTGGPAKIRIRLTLPKGSDDDHDDDNDNDDNGEIKHKNTIPKKSLPPPSKSSQSKSSPANQRKKSDTKSTTSSTTTTSPPKKKIKKENTTTKTTPSSTKTSEKTTTPNKKSSIPKIKRVGTGGTASTEEGAEEVKATIVDSDEAGEDDAVAAVVEEPIPKIPKLAAAKKRPQQLVRPVRFPPISSPGLLIPPTAGIHRGAADKSGFTSPESVFEHSMSMAGYTTEGRTQRPHRGSSVKRVVGDMFDSNVKFTLNFPKLVPNELLKKSQRKVDDNDDDDYDIINKNESYLEKFTKTIDSISTQTKQDTPIDSSTTMNGSTSRKRRKLMSFSDLAPKSLTLPYPENYIRKRQEYVKKVKEREKAIIAYQEAEEAREIAKEEMELNDPQGKSKEGENGVPRIPQVVIPPIPEPPSPPKLREFESLNPDDFEDQHPIYLPKGREQFVEHLDNACFHITEGRYFGLFTNSIADPHFVGANAPGLSGLNLSAGTGLATALAGGSNSAAVLSSTAHTGTGVTNIGPSKSGGGGKAGTKRSSSGSGGGNGAGGGASGATGKASSGSNGKKPVGPAPTSSGSALKKLVEAGGVTADQIRDCIIRAAVHASRVGKHGRSFKAPDGETYPDVSKAFAAHAGLKPCMRCKNNKQGAYHCRLRRKHKELDYDGSNSPAILAPLFELPIEDLLWKPP